MSIKSPKKPFLDKKFASNAGKQAHKLKKAHIWTSEEARKAAIARWEKQKDTLLTDDE